MLARHPMLYQVTPFQFHMDALQLLCHITFIYSTHLFFGGSHGLETT